MKSPRGLPATTLPEGAFGEFHHTEREIELSCCKAAFLLSVYLANSHKIDFKAAQEPFILFEYLIPKNRKRLCTGFCESNRGIL